jgi:Na+-driven multidrug efflux pump
MDFKLFDIKLFKDVLRIGWPIGVNTSCWVGSQLFIFSFIGLIGAQELAARTYMNTLESFCFMLGFSIAMSVQIQIAHLFGAGRLKDAYSSAYRAMWIGLLLVTMNAALLYIFGKQLLGLFTSNQEIIQLGASLLVLNLVLQPGKMLNMALGNALNAIGDTRFSMVTALFSMWIVATIFSYIIGVHWGYGLIGIYICMIADEYLRGMFSLFRWRGRKYLRMAEQKKMTATRVDNVVNMEVMKENITAM